MISVSFSFILYQSNIWRNYQYPVGDVQENWQLLYGFFCCVWGSNLGKKWYVFKSLLNRLIVRFITSIEWIP